MNPLLRRIMKDTKESFAGMIPSDTEVDFEVPLEKALSALTLSPSGARERSRQLETSMSLAILAGWFHGFADFLSGSRYADQERYLAEASNVMELEQRMRALERSDDRFGVF